VGSKNHNFCVLRYGSGAALRAKAISAFLSGIRYRSSAAILGYGFLDCDSICGIAPSAAASTALANPILLSVLRTISSLSVEVSGQSGSYDAAIPLNVASIIPTSMYVMKTSVSATGEALRGFITGDNRQLTRRRPDLDIQNAGVGKVLL